MTVVHDLSEQSLVIEQGMMNREDFDELGTILPRHNSDRVRFDATPTMTPDRDERLAPLIDRLTADVRSGRARGHRRGGPRSPRPRRRAPRAVGRRAVRAPRAWPGPTSNPPRRLRQQAPPPPSFERRCAVAGGAPHCRASSATSSCSKNSAAAAWASSTRPGRRAWTASSR